MSLMRNNIPKNIAKFLLGPILFFIINKLEITSLSNEGKIVLALYVWIVAWWVFKPTPWSISAFLPLVIIPITGLMKIGDVAALYGQKVLFFLVGVLSLGRAIEKTGLCKRIAIVLLQKMSKSGSVYKIIISFLAFVTVMSAFVDDAAAIAICMPIGITIVDCIKEASGKDNVHKLSVFVILGILYCSEAGGIMAVSGIPHIAVALSILEKTANISLSFLQWSSVGVIMGVISFVIYILILRIFCKPEVEQIDNARQIFVSQNTDLGKITKSEIAVIVVLFVMLFLWVLPSFIKVSFLNVWIVPVIGTLLLYVIPNENQGENILSAGDFQEHMPWDIIFLVTGGSVMASLSTDFGVVDFFQSLIKTNISSLGLLCTASFFTAILSNFISGTAAVNIMSNIFMPVALSIGVNPVMIAYLLPSSGMAILLPWAGAATGTTFSSGRVTITDMIKTGIIATILHASAMVLIVIIFVPILIK